MAIALLSVIALAGMGLGFAADRYLLDDAWRTLKITAWTTIGFGVLLLAIDRMSMTVKRVEHAGFADTLFVAVGQVLSLVPGVSRPVKVFCWLTW